MKNKKLQLFYVTLATFLIMLTKAMGENLLVQAHMAGTDIATPVSITDQGLDPQEVTIPVGSSVNWTNFTASPVYLVEGELHQVYLPLAMGNTGNQSRSGVSVLKSIQTLSAMADWQNVEILPGESYSLTFNTAGNYPYFTVGSQVHTGLVIVGGALFDSVLYMAEDTGAATIDDNDSIGLGEGDGEDFTIEVFFYTPDLNYVSDGVDVLARKDKSFSFYVDFFNDKPDIIFFTAELLGVGEILLMAETELQVGWHHVAAVFDNEYTENEDAMTIFLDGIRAAHSPDGNYHPDWTPGLVPSTRNLDIGGVWGGRSGFHGYLEEIRISDIVRYNNLTYSVPTAPFTSDSNTVALWHFDEIPGTTNFMDASSYGNHLTGYGGAQTYRP